MLMYMPGSYWLSLNVCNAVHCGASLGDVEQSCRGARELLEAGVTDRDERVVEAWMAGWREVGERLAAEALADSAAGRAHSASRKHHRAAVHLMIAEWLTPFGHPHKVPTFDLMRNNFIAGLPGSGTGATAVQIPFEGGLLDAVCVPAGGPERPAPALIHFNGTHSTLEWPFLGGFTRALAERGIASLLFDHPGTGSARYHGNLPLRPDSEVPAAAAIDYLASRPDIDPDRIGVMGGSMGGYHAPRAAAFEKRLRACLCWGALYQLPQWLLDYAHGEEARDDSPIRDTGMTHALATIFGADMASELPRMVAGYSLDVAVGEILCPLYVLHGRNDRQVPVSQARLLIERAVRSSHKILIESTPSLGEEHCNLDNLPAAVEQLSDWAAEALVSKPATL